MHLFTLLTILQPLPHLLGARASNDMAKRSEPAPLKRASGNNAIPGKYIVKFKRSTTTSIRDYFLGIMSGETDYIYSRVFNGFARSMTEAEVKLIRDSQDVEYVAEDIMGSGKGIIEQSEASWGLGRISHRERGASKYIYDESAGEGTCVYVLDSGIHDTHPDFGGRAKQIKSFVPGETADGHGHGTHVAGIIGSKTFGVAKKSKIFGVKVLENKDLGAPASRLISGMEFVEEDMEKRKCPKGVFVNLSGGSPYSDALNDAASALVESGVFFGAAAGNTGEDSKDFSPGSDPSVCLVGGTDSEDKPFHVSDTFSSNWGSAIDIFAPARDILSTDRFGGNVSFTGTSQAAPFVVGLAAYLASLEGLSGTKALCDRIRQLATKDAIVGQRKDTVNLLAFNGAVQEVRAPCKKIKSLVFGFALSKDYWSGTFDRVGATLAGPAGQISLAIADKPSRGFKTQIPVDMQSSLGSGTIDIGGINRIDLTAQGLWDVAPGTLHGKNDKWQVQDIKLLAECVEPGYKVEYNKLVSLNTWYGHPGGWFGKSDETKTVASFNIAAEDWHIKAVAANVKGQDQGRGPRGRYGTKDSEIL